jgi:hypothetical protein
MTFKTEIHELCKEVAGEFENWSFSTSSGLFRNKTLKHTDLIVEPGFNFTSPAPSCNTSPSAAVDNKKVGKLFKQICGFERYFTLHVKYQLELEDYYSPNTPRRVTNIFPEKFPFSDAHGVPQVWPATWIVQAQAKDYIRKVLVEGIDILNKYFDLTTEENLLRHLPLGYKTRSEYRERGFYESQDGIAHCLAAIVLGNFDFVERYASDDFKTIVPKQEIELKKILAALPELKRKYAETGKMI